MSSVIQLTTAPSGTGKTLRRCAWFLIHDFLPNREGIHISNFPIGLVPDDHRHPPTHDGETFTDRIYREVAKRTKRDVSEFEGRLEVIPEDEIKRWKTGKSGPWDYFADRDLAGAHVAIDEIHNFCGTATSRSVQQQWQIFLGDVRHRGATVELISQHRNKVAKCIKDESGIEFVMFSLLSQRDPFFGISREDWMELKAGLFTGVWDPIFVERLKEARGKDRKEDTHATVYRIDPHYFQFYNSFNKPEGGGVAGQQEKHQFERRSKLGLLAWFVGTHFMALSSRLVIAAFLWWLLFMGGGATLITWGLDYMGKAVAADQGIKGTPADMSRDLEPSRVVGAGSVPDSSSLVSPELEQLRSDVGRLNSEINSLREERDVLRKKLAVLELERAKATALVAVEKGAIVLRNGYRYRVGEVIDFGPYSNRMVKSVNYRKRTATLSDGAVLRLGHNLGIESHVREIVE